MHESQLLVSLVIWLRSDKLNQSFDMLTFLKLIGKLEEKFVDLPLSHKKALSAEPDEIMYTTPGDVGFYYDNDGK